MEGISGGEVHLRWYGSINWGTRKALEKDKVTWFKHWTVSGTAALKRALGISDIHEKPELDKIKEFWSADSYEVNSGVFVPLAVPAGGTVEQLWTRESVSLSSEFLRDYLIPACKECGCTN